MTPTIQASGIRTVVARNPSEIDEIRDEWEALTARHAQFACAQNDAVRLMVETRILADRLAPRVVLFKDENGPRGIVVGKLFDQKIRCRIGYVKLPLMTLKCFAVAYGGIVTDGTGEARDAVFDYLTQIRRDSQVDYVMINHLPASHELFSRIKNSGPDMQTADVHWRWWLGKTAEESLSHRSGKTRRTIRRDDKRLCAQFNTELRLRRWEHEGEVDELCTVASQIAAKGYQGAMQVGFVDTPLWREFLKEEARCGRLRSYTLEGDGKAIAFQVGVLRRGVCIMEGTAFLPELRAFSPGQVLQIRIVEDLCQDRARAIDWGFGDAHYKQVFGTERAEETTFYFYGRRAKAQIAKRVVGFCDRLTDTIGRAVRRVGFYDRIKRNWRRRMDSRAEA